MGKKDLRHRTQYTSTLKNELYHQLQRLSQDSQVPISRLIDAAVTEFLNKHPQMRV
jgi:hypothetical protein